MVYRRPAALPERRIGSLYHLYRCQGVFGANQKRFFAAYREWLRGGDPALGRLLSPALSEAWRAGSGALETLVLPYVYADLSELVQTA